MLDSTLEAVRSRSLPTHGALGDGGFHSSVGAALPSVGDAPVPFGDASVPFGDDTRAIEGLPIRLVIALVVGVASLSLMLNMLTGIQGLTTTELDARPTPEIVAPGETTVSVEAIGSDGVPVADATIVVKGGSADLDRVATAKTNDDGVATLELDPTLRANQAEGTLVVEVKPPAGSSYQDRRGNTKILVVRE